MNQNRAEKLMGEEDDLEQQIDVSDYEDTLILFVMRLLQLQTKQYYRRYKPPEVRVQWNGEETAIRNIEIVETDVDEELFVSYLSVVRQFWANNDALSVHRIKGILLYAARLLKDAARRDRIKALDRDFRARWNKGVHVYSDSSGNELVRLSQHELVSFWFNTVYFHTEPRNLGIAVPLLQSGAFTKWSRVQFEIYLHNFVGHVQALGREAISVLWKGLFPPGKLHRLLEMYVPLETYIEERRRESASGGND